ncbi:EF-P lysine aminoacylase EpmA [Lignipirellula cremea]|uniref:Elongation factor P--(R)-beta-lysine ligase n=1 Tax=Lignipirellula cremea TaxID=2528010 RepID=A0A518DZK5_9BACT|nr:EF-P lysine aminoacylase EpmA [Lignipirellula cremea]QDU97274.1 Elongation factor P--(R)-beta-lysine ligase [Lignipirellula cremea]
MAPHSSAPDFGPTASLETLRFRAKLLQQTRAFFDTRDFWEVETPLLSADTVVDRHLDPLSAVLFPDPCQPETGRTLWLQTSPEFAMKRLLAAGAEAIYQITHAFRGAEQGDRHNPEFTLLEWYRVGDDLHAGMELLADFCEAILGRRPERLSYRQAFLDYAGVDPLQADTSELRDALGDDRPANLSLVQRDEWLNLLLALKVEPHLGVARPTLLHSYPPSQAALARVAGDPPVAERFELYVAGIELANGYHELLDADVLRARNASVNQQRQSDGKRPLPADSRLLQAMDAGLPACAGTALGFDRLMMLAAGKRTIAEVIAFPIDRA